MVHRFKRLFLFRLSRNIIFLTFYFLHLCQKCFALAHCLRFDFLRSIPLSIYSTQSPSWLKQQ